MAKAKRKSAPVTLEVKLKDFRRRWSIDLNEEARWQEFRDRAMNSFADTVGTFFLSDDENESELHRIIGVHLRGKRTSEDFSDWSVRREIGSSAVYNLLLSTASMPQFVERIQAVFWVSKIPSDRKENLKTRLREDIGISGVPIAVSGKGGATLLHPSGAKELDLTLVDEVLLWFDEIPAARERYAAALSLYGKPGHVRDVADNLRRSLEETLRHVLGNSKSLENQQKELGTYLKQRGIAPEIGASYWKLIDLYSKFQNDRVKHGDKVIEQEVELVLYLTGTFIRFLLTLR